VRVEEYQAEYWRRLQALVAGMPGGEAAFVEAGKKPGYAAGVGLAAVAGFSPEVRAKHIDDLAGLAGTPGHEEEGDRDEALGREFLKNLRAGLSVGGALWLEGEVVARLEARAQERGMTVLGLMGSMGNTFKLAEKGLTRF
jgi:hypothetical protein